MKLFIYIYCFLYSIDCIPEKAKLKKWGLLAFAKKPKSTLSLQKEADGAILCEKGIKQVKQLIEYLSRDECKTFNF